MKLLALILIFIVSSFLFDFFFHFIPGLIMVRFPSCRRLGFRYLALSGFGARLCGKLCMGPCDGSCGNWTCPKFR